MYGGSGGGGSGGGRGGGGGGNGGDGGGDGGAGPPQRIETSSMAISPLYEDPLIPSNVTACLFTATFAAFSQDVPQLPDFVHKILPSSSITFSVWILVPYMWYQKSIDPTMPFAHSVPCKVNVNLCPY